MTARERVKQLAQIFPEVYPGAHCELDFKNPLQLLDRDDSFGAMHGQAREHGHARVVQEIPDGGGLREGAAGRTRESD